MRRQSAAVAAARDERLTAALLVHGAADNELWLEVQLARRVDQAFLHKPLAKLVYWLAYGPAFDTPTYVAQIAPRPVPEFVAPEATATRPPEPEPPADDEPERIV